MIRPIHGRIHGKTIELNEDLGVPDGQEVEVVVRPVRSNAPWGEGIKRSAGIAADIAGIDKVFEEIQRDRRASLFRDIEE